jgi:SAM-dependent methyltransferase
MKETNSLPALSPAKKQKLSAILAMLGNTAGKTCMDIGADNGVISYYLRKNGGSWTSADLDDETVESIKSFVGNSVIKTDGRTLPFRDSFFDAAVIVDFLEHIEDDRAFILELYRAVKPGGSLIINVPLKKPGSFLAGLRAAGGYTDEKHGHLRPGYTVRDIKALLEGMFRITEHTTYTGFFTELADSLANIAMLKASGGRTGRKGNVMTSKKAGKKKGALNLYSLITPLMSAFSLLDPLVPRREGANLLLNSSSLKRC